MHSLTERQTISQRLLHRAEKTEWNDEQQEQMAAILEKEDNLIVMKIVIVAGWVGRSQPDVTIPLRLMMY